MRISHRAAVLIILDILLILGSFYLSLFLRFDGAIETRYLTAIIPFLPVFAVVYISSFYLFRMYHRLWEYASIQELLAIVMASTLASAICTIIVFAIDWRLVPRSIHIINWVLVIVFVGSSRLTWRVLRDKALNRAKCRQNRTLIVGAGDAGSLVARELQTNWHEANLCPIGFVDDSPKKQSMYLHGLKVLGTRYDIPQIVKKHRVDNIIVAMPSVSGSVVRDILQICGTTPAKLKILPGVYQLIDGQVSVKKIRDVELEDLLQREPVQLNLEGISEYLHDKTVLVTGAGGSIGSELCRQICRFRPQCLVLLDNCENNLYEIDLELSDRFPGAQLIPCLTDIKDAEKLALVFEKYQPQVVFHAAAYKHVPMMEFNPDEAVKNNVFGTKNIAEAADRFGVETFILISTDKAVNPTSVMGTTKRIAEMVVQKIGKKSKTRFAAVRFGNVLGSRGSVVPLFKQQIARGGPVTVTHSEMTRYFMTIPEAVQLVIQAGALARGGEIFLLDMGEPVKIIDLARDLIRLSGLKPDEDIKIKVMGIRPGEKLFEELLTKEEAGTGATAHERIFIAHTAGIDNDKVENLLFNKLQRRTNLDTTELVKLLKEIVPEFNRPEKSQIS